MTKSIFSNDFYKEIEKDGPRVDIRQTVLTGPRDVNGRADFLQAGTGLQAITKDLSVDPLVITFGDGFSRFGQRDRTIENSTALSWNALPASETSFLYVDLLADGTLQTGHTVLEPVYSQARPATPATGQAFYPTSHAHRMEFFDGTSWIKKLRIFVGEAVTDATVVTSSISYDYGIGRGYEAPLGSGQKWVNVGGERTLGQTYTNNTGRPIQLSIAGYFSNGDYAFRINGEVVEAVSSSSSYWVFKISNTIPNDASYSLEGTNVALPGQRWYELR